VICCVVDVVICDVAMLMMMSVVKMNVVMFDEGAVLCCLI